MPHIGKVVMDCLRARGAADEQQRDAAGRFGSGGGAPSRRQSETERRRNAASAEISNKYHPGSPAWRQAVQEHNLKIRRGEL